MVQDVHVYIVINSLCPNWIPSLHGAYFMACGVWLWVGLYVSLGVLIITVSSQSVMIISYIKMSVFVSTTY